MTVEKVDLKGLFSPECEKFHVPLINISGWNDINSRAAIMRRFAHWESRGKKCVLLHCGDHDPGGLHISDFLRSNMGDLGKRLAGRRMISSSTDLDSTLISFDATDSLGSTT